MRLLIYLGWHAKFRRYRNEIKSRSEVLGLGLTFALTNHSTMVNVH